MKNKYSFTYYLALLLALTCSLTGCSSNKAMEYNRDIFAMDTLINCKIISEDKELAQRGLDAVEDAFQRIDQMTNRFEESSDVYLLNRNAGVKPVKVSKDVFDIVQTSMIWSEKSNGAFNILIGRAMDLWGFGTDKPYKPDDAEIAAAIENIDCQKIIMDSDKSTIFLPEKGMVMDLGGVAKGYATDKAVVALKELGIEHALINAGGNVYTMGGRSDGGPWKVGVQDPDNPDGIKAVLQVSDEALVSSGDYQRYFEEDGIRYHHILDPESGFPSRASSGTTIIMDSATIADILSTTLFVLGPEKGIAFAENLPEVKGAMIISDEGQIVETDSLKNYLIE